jgi:diguanylate cyclase (GGDEF)-like protein
MGAQVTDGMLRAAGGVRPSQVRRRAVARWARVLGWLLLAAQPVAADELRVGLYENSPKVYRDAAGRPAGLFVELLEAMARHEGWSLRYVDCAWSDCLDRLARGELDLMPDVAHSPARQQRFDFHQRPVAHSWSTLLVPRESPINSAPDLSGKRIAVLRGGVQEEALRRMMGGLGLGYRVLLVDRFAEGLAALAEGRAEALASNSFYAGRHAHALGLRETALVFDPATLYFATPKGRHAPLRATIDRYLERWRQDSDSIYFHSLRRAMAPLPEPASLTPWQRVGLWAGLLLMLGLMALSLLQRQQVRQRTRQLQRSQAQLEFLARHDALTGLPNRLELDEQLQQAITAAAGRPLALMLLNVDRLHRINDAWGHEAGDALLVEVAERLRRCAVRGETLARLGSDEFAVLLERFEHPDEVVALASRMLAEIAKVWPHRGQNLIVTASIGVSLYPGDGRSAGELLKSADTALTTAKTLGCNGLQFASSQMNAHVARWIEIEQHLRQALEQGQFHLHYQPRVALRDGGICGAEALLRWNSPQLGAVSPADFVPVAEDVGLIGALGSWVLRAACAQARAWRDAGLPALPLAVNVSAQQLHDGDLVAEIAALLAEFELPAAALEIELTESVMLRQSEATLAQMEALGKLGVLVALDDFGTGYSSLGYLGRMALDSLKIDQGFVRGLPADRKSAAIAQATIGLAHGLGIKVIAEGVETPAQRDFLRAAGCDEAQGYLFSRALPPESLARWLSDAPQLLAEPPTSAV